MSTILGAHSSKLDAVRALRTKAGRAEQRRFAIEGPTLLADALAAGHRPEELFVTERGEQSIDPAGRAALADRTFVIPEKAMARLSDLETPPGILAVMPAAFATPAELFDGSPVVILAGVADPGNAGTLLRTAEIFGITRALFTSDGVEPHNPKVVRATMGATFRMRMAVAPGPDGTAAARQAGYDIVAADREGLPLPTFIFPERCAIAIGNERRGVAGSLDSWQRTVAIPQHGQGESLNAAIAGGIIFYTFSQRVRNTN
jgi:TrmH family RNA methyltransferase